MRILIVLADLTLAGAFFLSGLFFLFMVCFGGFIQSDTSREQSARSGLFARVILIVICVLLFGIAWYDFRFALRKEFVPLPAVVLQAPLLWRFVRWTIRFIVNYWRHARVKTLADSGRDDEAIELIERWIESSRQPGAELYNLIGFIHLKNRDWESAARQFRRAADIADDAPAYLCNLAIALNGMERADEALELIAQAERKDPFSSDRYAFNRCHFLAQAGRTGEARVLLPQAERYYEISRRLPPLQRRYLTETMSKINHLCDRPDPDSVPSD